MCGIVGYIGERACVDILFAGLKRLEYRGYDSSGIAVLNEKEISLVTFANSLTLTPGTITMYVSVEGAFQVHAIDKASGDPLPGEMEKRIARAFEDE